MAFQSGFNLALDWFIHRLRFSNGHTSVFAGFSCLTKLLSADGQFQMHVVADSMFTVIHDATQLHFKSLPFNRHNIWKCTDLYKEGNPGKPVI